MDSNNNSTKQDDQASTAAPPTPASAAQATLVVPTPIQAGSMPLPAFKKPAPVTVSGGGSPESGAVVETKPGTTAGNSPKEYGYDAIKQIEKKAEQTKETGKEAAAELTKEATQTIEAKEPQAPQAGQPQAADDQAKAAASQEDQALKLPKFSGFQLSEEVQKDFEPKIKEWRHKDGHDSEFGLAIFLERLLRIESNKANKDK